MCHDRINALAIEALTRETEYDALLGCQDRCVRVVQGSALEFEGQLDAPVTALRRYARSPAAARAPFGAPKEVVYGTDDGQLGMLLMHEQHAQRQWSVPNPARHGTVNVLESLDVTKDDVADILVGRSDGRVQVGARRGVPVGARGARAPRVARPRDAAKEPRAPPEKVF
jgi:Bardet-Biedl syndrome 7 protein